MCKLCRGTKDGRDILNIGETNSILMNTIESVAE